eukprot:g12980.t1
MKEQLLFNQVLQNARVRKRRLLKLAREEAQAQKQLEQELFEAAAAEAAAAKVKEAEVEDSAQLSFARKIRSDFSGQDRKTRDYMKSFVFDVEDAESPPRAAAEMDCAGAPGGGLVYNAAPGKGMHEQSFIFRVNGLVRHVEVVFLRILAQQEQDNSATPSTRTVVLLLNDCQRSSSTSAGGAGLGLPSGKRHLQRQQLSSFAEKHLKEVLRYAKPVRTSRSYENLPSVYHVRVFELRFSVSSCFGATATGSSVEQFDDITRTSGTVHEWVHIESPRVTDDDDLAQQVLGTNNFNSQTSAGAGGGGSTSPGADPNARGAAGGAHQIAIGPSSAHLSRMTVGGSAATIGSLALLGSTSAALTTAVGGATPRGTGNVIANLHGLFINQNKYSGLQRQNLNFAPAAGGSGPSPTPAQHLHSHPHHQGGSVFQPKPWDFSKNKVLKDFLAENGVPSVSTNYSDAALDYLSNGLLSEAFYFKLEEAASTSGRVKAPAASAASCRESRASLVASHRRSCCSSLQEKDCRITLVCNFNAALMVAALPAASERPATDNTNHRNYQNQNYAPAAAENSPQRAQAKVTAVSFQQLVAPGVALTSCAFGGHGSGSGGKNPFMSSSGSGSEPERGRRVQASSAAVVGKTSSGGGAAASAAGAPALSRGGGGGPGAARPLQHPQRHQLHLLVDAWRRRIPAWPKVLEQDGSDHVRQQLAEMFGSNLIDNVVQEVKEYGVHLVLHYDEEEVDEQRRLNQFQQHIEDTLRRQLLFDGLPRSYVAQLAGVVTKEVLDAVNAVLVAERARVVTPEFFFVERGLVEVSLKGHVLKVCGPGKSLSAQVGLGLIAHSHLFTLKAKTRDVRLWKLSKTNFDKIGTAGQREQVRKNFLRLELKAYHWGLSENLQPSLYGGGPRGRESNLTAVVGSEYHDAAADGVSKATSQSSHARRATRQRRSAIPGFEQVVGSSMNFSPAPASGISILSSRTRGLSILDAATSGGVRVQDTTLPPGSSSPGGRGLRGAVAAVVAGTGAAPAPASSATSTGIKRFPKPFVGNSNLTILNEAGDARFLVACVAKLSLLLLKKDDVLVCGNDDELMRTYNCSATSSTPRPEQSQSQNQKRLFFLYSGSCAVYVGNNLAEILQDGACVGEHVLTGVHSHYHYSVVARTDSILFALRREDYLELLRRFPLARAHFAQAIESLEKATAEFVTSLKKRAPFQTCGYEFLEKVGELAERIDFGASASRQPLPLTAIPGKFLRKWTEEVYAAGGGGGGVRAAYGYAGEGRFGGGTARAPGLGAGDGGGRTPQSSKVSSSTSRAVSGVLYQGSYHHGGGVNFCSSATRASPTTCSTGASYMNKGTSTSSKHTASETTAQRQHRTSSHSNASSTSKTSAYTMASNANASALGSCGGASPSANLRTTFSQSRGRNGNKTQNWLEVSFQEDELASLRKEESRYAKMIKANEDNTKLLHCAALVSHPLQACASIHAANYFEDAHQGTLSGWGGTSSRFTFGAARDHAGAGYYGETSSGAQFHLSQELMVKLLHGGTECFEDLARAFLFEEGMNSNSTVEEHHQHQGHHLHQANVKILSHIFLPAQNRMVFFEKGVPQAFVWGQATDAEVGDMFGFSYLFGQDVEKARYTVLKQSEEVLQSQMQLQAGLRVFDARGGGDSRGRKGSSNKSQQTSRVNFAHQHLKTSDFEEEELSDCLLDDGDGTGTAGITNAGLDHFHLGLMGEDGGPEKQLESLAGWLIPKYLLLRGLQSKPEVGTCFARHLVSMGALSKWALEEQTGTATSSGGTSSTDASVVAAISASTSRGSTFGAASVSPAAFRGPTTASGGRVGVGRDEQPRGGQGGIFDVGSCSGRDGPQSPAGSASTSRFLMQKKAFRISTLPDPSETAFVRPVVVRMGPTPTAASSTSSAAATSDSARAGMKPKRQKMNSTRFGRRSHGLHWLAAVESLKSLQLEPYSVLRCVSKVAWFLPLFELAFHDITLCSTGTAGNTTTAGARSSTTTTRAGGTGAAGSPGSPTKSHQSARYPTPREREIARAEEEKRRRHKEERLKVNLWVQNLADRYEVEGLFESLEEEYENLVQGMFCVPQEGNHEQGGGTGNGNANDACSRTSNTRAGGEQADGSKAASSSSDEQGKSCIPALPLATSAPAAVALAGPRAGGGSSASAFAVKNKASPRAGTGWSSGSGKSDAELPQPSKGAEVLMRQEQRKMSTMSAAAGAGGNSSSRPRRDHQLKMKNPRKRTGGGSGRPEAEAGGYSSTGSADRLRKSSPRINPFAPVIRHRLRLAARNVLRYLIGDKSVLKWSTGFRGQIIHSTKPKNPNAQNSEMDDSSHHQQTPGDDLQGQDGLQGSSASDSETLLILKSGSCFAATQNPHPLYLHSLHAPAAYGHYGIFWQDCVSSPASPDKSSSCPTATVFLRCESVTCVYAKLSKADLVAALLCAGFFTDDLAVRFGPDEDLQHSEEKLRETDGGVIDEEVVDNFRRKRKLRQNRSVLGGGAAAGDSTSENDFLATSTSENDLSGSALGSGGGLSLSEREGEVKTSQNDRSGGSSSGRDEQPRRNKPRGKVTIVGGLEGGIISDHEMLNDPEAHSTSSCIKSSTSGDDSSSSANLRRQKLGGARMNNLAVPAKVRGGRAASKNAGSGGSSSGQGQGVNLSVKTPAGAKAGNMTSGGSGSGSGSMTEGDMPTQLALDGSSSSGAGRSKGLPLGLLLSEETTEIKSLYAKILLAMLFCRDEKTVVAPPTTSSRAGGGLPTKVGIDILSQNEGGTEKSSLACSQQCEGDSVHVDNPAAASSDDEPPRFHFGTSDQLTSATASHQAHLRCASPMKFIAGLREETDFREIYSRITEHERCLAAGAGHFGDTASCSEAEYLSNTSRSNLGGATTATASTQELHLRDRRAILLSALRILGEHRLSDSFLNYLIDHYVLLSCHQANEVIVREHESVSSSSSAVRVFLEGKPLKKTQDQNVIGYVSTIGESFSSTGGAPGVGDDHGGGGFSGLGTLLHQLLTSGAGGSTASSAWRAGGGSGTTGGLSLHAHQQHSHNGSSAAAAPIVESVAAALSITCTSKTLVAVLYHAAVEEAGGKFLASQIKLEPHLLGGDVAGSAKVLRYL